MSRPGALAFAGWMLAAVAASVATRDARWCAAAGLAALVARAVAAWGRWTPSGRFGAANAVTLARLVAIAALPRVAGRVAPLAFVAVVALLLALDAVDGRLARARGDASPFGAAFDMESDALLVMLLALLLWLGRGVPAWVLAAGLWRYAYAAIVALSPSLGEAPRSRLARGVFVLLVGSLTLAFVPWLPARPLAAIGTLAVSLSFLRSLRQSRR